MKQSNGSSLRSVPIEDLRMLLKPLLSWYDQYGRILPWRSQPEPYRVWVSEMMLQQTQVKTVLPYFERFMAALPDIETLASADEADLLKLWEGLGYYTRARNLQKAARIVVARHNGILPDSYEQLLELPGIGEYSAGAIASIAYNIPVPVVDGNVLRLLARLLASPEDIAQTRVRKAFRAIMAAILPYDRPGDFNQAVMELGATVCMPNMPRCADCPIKMGCAANQQGCVQQFPVKTPKAPRRIEHRTVLLILAEGKVLLRQRPKQGLLAGLWELPNLEGWLNEDIIASTLEQWGLRPSTLERLPDERHIFTHIEWQMRGFLMQCMTGQQPEGYIWADMQEIELRYAVPGAFKIYMKHLPFESPGQHKPLKRQEF